MNRDEKAQAVAELTDRLKEAEAVFAIDYRGISVTQAAELRRRLAEADATFKIVKNRLAKRAAADAGTDGIDEVLVGPTALTLIKGDAVIAAKAVATFNRESGLLEFKGGLMDGEALEPDAFRAIARLPGIEVLRGQLVGVAASPLTGLVRGLGSLLSGLAVALGQIAEQGLVTGEAPAGEAGAAEDAPEATAAEGAPEATAAEGAPEEPAADGAPEEPAAEPESEVPAEAEAADDRGGGGETAAEDAAAEPEVSEAEGETANEENENGGGEQAPADESEE